MSAGADEYYSNLMMGINHDDWVVWDSDIWRAEENRETDRTVMDILGRQRPWQEEDMSNIEYIQEEGDPIVQWIQLAIDRGESVCFILHVISLPLNITLQNWY